MRAIVRVSCAGVMLWGATAQAQWSDDPTQNLPVADRTGTQAQVKVRATADGGCYISWFDSDPAGSPPFGYDVYLQRLDADGVEQWAHNGVLIADRGYSSTQDYGLDVDDAGNAVITYRDDRSGPSQIGVNLVSPSGTLLWGEGGVVVSITANGNSPRVAATSDGHYVVGWSLGTGIRLQKLDADGVAQWPADGIVQQPATGSYGLSWLEGSEDGSVIASWSRPIGSPISSPKHLYTQKFDANGNPMWDGAPGVGGVNEPIVVFDGGSLQIGYFPRFVPDGAGGAVYAWYDTGGLRDVFVQHVNVAGIELFPHNGVSSSIRPDRTQVSPELGYNTATGEIFVAWVEMNTLQSLRGISAQKFDAAGARQWGDFGVDIIPIGGDDFSFVNVWPLGCGAVVSAIKNPFGGSIIATRLDAAGAPVWSPQIVDACSVISGKSRLNVALSVTGVSLLAWGDSRDDDGDIYAQNVNPDGSLGPAPLAGDLDNDGNVDLDDVAAFFDCTTGPGGCAPSACIRGDADTDGDIDFADFADVQRAFTGPP